MTKPAAEGGDPIALTGRWVFRTEAKKAPAVAGMTRKVGR